MKTTALMIILLMATPLATRAAGERFAAGGRSAAMGGVSVTFTDLWSAGNNPAGPAFLSAPCAGAGAGNRFLLPGLTCQYLAAGLPIRTGTFGLSATRSGDSRCSELTAGVGYALKLARNFSAGVRIGWFCLRFGSGYGSRHAVTCEAGLLYHAGRDISLGVHLTNPVPVKIARKPAETLPASLCFGLSFRISDDFTLAAEAGKDLFNPLSAGAGAEYRVARAVRLRVGVSGAPVSFTFGGGLTFGRVTFDIASAWHPVLGFSPTASLSYSFH